MASGAVFCGGPAGSGRRRDEVWQQIQKQIQKRKDSVSAVGLPSRLSRGMCRKRIPDEISDEDARSPGGGRRTPAEQAGHLGSGGHRYRGGAMTKAGNGEQTVGGRRVAIVTGGAQGVGLVIAKRLHDEGHRVVIADPRASEVLPEGLGDRSVIADVDVTDRAQVDALVALVVQRFERIDVLVNAAGVFSSLKRQRFDQISLDEWRWIFAVHVEGAWHCACAVAAQMKSARAGSIVNLGSASAWTGNPDLLPYVSSQGALLAMTECLSRGLGEFGIRVNAVAPGLVSGEGTMPSEHLTSQRIEAARRARALHADVSADAVAAAVSYLVSDAAGMVTGQVLKIDGGSAMR